MAKTLKKHAPGTVEVIPPRRRAGAPIGNFNRIKNQPRFITQALVMRLLEEVTDPRSKTRSPTAKKKMVDWLVDVVIEKALEGDSTYMKMIFDRIEGTPHATMLFKPIDENAVQSDDMVVTVTREKLASMTYEEQLALYNSTLNDSSGAAATN